jgi:hypothetical protein
LTQPGTTSHQPDPVFTGIWGERNVRRRLPRFVLADGRARGFRVEYAGMVLFTGRDAVGLGLSAPAVLAVGYLPVQDWPPGPRALMHAGVPGHPSAADLLPEHRSP